MIIAHLYSDNNIHPVSKIPSLYSTLCGIEHKDLPKGHNVFYYTQSLKNRNYEPCDTCFNHPVGQMKLLAQTEL